MRHRIIERTSRTKTCTIFRNVRREKLPRVRNPSWAGVKAKETDQWRWSMYRTMGGYSLEDLKGKFLSFTFEHADHKSETTREQIFFPAAFINHGMTLPLDPDLVKMMVH